MAAFVVTLAICLWLDVPRWATSMLVPATPMIVGFALVRHELRGVTLPSRPYLALAAAHLLLPIVGVPLAIEGLRTHNRALAIVGTSLLGLVVVNSAVILPWRTARRHSRERARRAR